MSSILNASASGGLVSAGDTSATLELQSDGTTKFTVSPTGAYGTLLRSTAVTASGTSIDFTDIPSWVKRITILFNGVSTNGGSHLLIQLGDSGGIETSGYTSNSVVAGGGVASVGISSTFGFGLVSGAASNLITGSIVIANISSNTWICSGSHSVSTGYTGSDCGSKSLSDTITQLRIIGSNTGSPVDTFDAGTVNILIEG